MSQPCNIAPRDTLNQQVLSARLTILPLIEDVHERQDLFGNRVSQFSVDELHTELNVLAESEVEVRPTRVDLDRDIAWDDQSVIPAKTRSIAGQVSMYRRGIQRFSDSHLDFLPPVAAFSNPPTR